MQTDAIRLICLLHCQLCSETLKQWCEDHPEFELVFAAHDGIYDVTTLAAHMPDVVVLDLDLPGDALRIATHIREQLTSVPIVIMGTKWADTQLVRALDAGARGLLVKSEPVEAVFEHLRQVVRGEVRISTEIRSRLRYDAQQSQYVLATSGTLFSLTAQQLEILRLLACGDSLKMVASKLKLSRKSIDGHKYRLMRKLGVKDRVLLSRLAIREGLIQA